MLQGSFQPVISIVKEKLPQKKEISWQVMTPHDLAQRTATYQVDLERKRKKIQVFIGCFWKKFLIFISKIVM